MRDLDEIERRATDAALWRMNYYKFDYSALMPWEQGMKSLAFPFYTYMRKAAPTLIEQLYTNPRYFAKPTVSCSTMTVLERMTSTT